MSAATPLPGHAFAGAPPAWLPAEPVPGRAMFFSESTSHRLSQPDEKAIRQFVDRLFERAREIGVEKPVFEVRVPNDCWYREQQYRDAGTNRGWFDNPDDMVREIVALDKRGSRAVYVTGNPCKPATLAKAANRIERRAPDATGENGIARRGWFIVDLDPKREDGVKGISSTDEERHHAHQHAITIRDGLAKDGWPKLPMMLDSGNGAWLLYPINLPNDEGSKELLRTALEALARRFESDDVELDKGVFVAHQLARVPGTHNRKGDDTEDRPHRRASFLHPGDGQEVSREQLEALVAAYGPPDETEAKAKTSTNGRPNAGSSDEWTAEEFARRNNLRILRSKPGPRGSTVYPLEACPFNPEHKRGESALIQESDGALGFRCLHASCSDHDWAALRAKLEPKVEKGREKKTPQPDDLDFATHQTETGVARRFAAMHRERARYVHAWRRWVLWNGCQWADDDDGGAMRLTTDVIQALYAEAANGSTKAEREALAAFAMRCESRTARKNVLELASVEEGVPISPEVFDADEMFFNVANGVLDLRDGSLRPHRPEDFLRKLCPTPFDPEATAPRWSRFLLEVMNGRRELVDYLQTLVGYSITGSTREHVLAFCHGSGANGKSVFLDVLQSVIGDDYARPAPPKLLMRRTHDEHPTELADLHGARFVHTSEVEDGARFAEAKLKALTGGDRIKCRRMKEDFWSFTPSHTLWLAANSKPRVDGQDYGIWRRIRLIPFDRTFTGDECDPDLPRKLMSEKEGILAWMVEGARRWNEGGLQDPDVVLEATTAYRAESDQFGRFVEEVCIVGEIYRVSTRALYAAYEKWARESGEHPRTKRAMGDWLRSKQFEEARTNSDRG